MKLQKNTEKCKFQGDLEDSKMTVTQWGVRRHLRGKSKDTVVFVFPLRSKEVWGANPCFFQREADLCLECVCVGRQSYEDELCCQDECSLKDFMVDSVGHIPRDLCLK